jgi:uncharacterized protein
MTPSGIEHDRRCLIVDPNGKLISMRDHPKLALVWTHLKRNLLKFGTTADDNLPDMELRLDKLAGIQMTVQVWDSTFQALVQPAEYSRWFSDFLGVDCLFVAVPDHLMRRRPMPELGTDMQIVGHDSSPVHAFSTGSSEDLFRRVRLEAKDGAEMLNPHSFIDRFRPNLLLQGLEPYEEEKYSRMVIGDRVTLLKCELPPRCGMINIDPATGHRTGDEPFRTLAGYKVPAGKKKPVFGVDYFPQGELGEIRVEDIVHFE